MTYTLTMASEQGIRIADDGVAEVSMTEARANLTRLIRTVREDDRPAAFTERGERRAYVVDPDWYERAQQDRRQLDAVNRAIGELPDEDRERLAARTVERYLSG